ncbi:anhydro-N-acetylmuramic acid kinase [Mucilaginibacter sp. RS28]|uniref:Anhydro-N-acetylmuramic acid kinase n=1 Tax=Mucilaginibacter straminoryzae TaxID=2932774 RepID=A0A9X1X3K9_9SPHI|nr:anhydro-N-acetylmuramic acid kinase [Mucilaginibacter straminoryzae]MCJ8210607.1 anhydro-N-acetylmuramic acid kinase [Mucilaginibacter straminoryzae]
MNRNLQQLFNMAEKESRLGIGLMSGTSLDGLDIALCRFNGTGLNTTFELLHFTTIAYEQDFKQDVLSVFAQKQVDLQKLCLLNAKIGSLHAEMILSALKQWRVQVEKVDFIASHGQTIYHAPRRLHQLPGYPDATLQIGDGDHIAVKTGILTISDFRQKQIAAGGEGAPLALYGDVILGSKTGENRLLLNIGGIANITYLPGDGGQVICTDIGPGNTLIDAACRKYFNKPYDEDALIASSGKVNSELLQALMDHPFFEEALPKTTGPELFSLAYVAEAQRNSATIAIAPEDLVATLTAFTAKVIVDFLRESLQNKVDQVFVSGGGARNPVVMQHLSEHLPTVQIQDTEAIGINPDAKEAILFALLGNEAIAGEPLAISSNPAVLMGKFSFPL